MVWVRPGGVLFVSQVGERHRLRWLAGRSLLSNGQGGLLLGNLTPLGSSFVVAPWPISLSPTGVLARSATAPTSDGKPDESEQFMTFADLRSAEGEGAVLRLNGKPFARLPSKSAARRWARWLTELRDVVETERLGRIEQALADSCDAAAAARTVEKCLTRTRWLRRVSAVLLVYCFALLGLAAFARLGPSLGDAILGYAILATLTFLTHARAQRHLIEAGVDTDGHGWMLLVWPVDAFRAADHLFRQRLEVYHPLALSLYLARRPAVEDLARRVVRDLRFPLPDLEASADLGAAKTAEWFAERMRQAILNMVAVAGLDPERFVVPPPQDESAVAYCPRCDGQFVRVTGPCTACGVALRLFSKT